VKTQPRFVSYQLQCVVLVHVMIYLYIIYTKPVYALICKEWTRDCLKNCENGHFVRHYLDSISCHVQGSCFVTFSCSGFQYCISTVLLLLMIHLSYIGWKLYHDSEARFPLPELTAWVDGWPVSITRQHGPCWQARVSTSHVDGPSTRLVETRARQRVMETGHPSTRAVNSGRQFG